MLSLWFGEAKHCYLFSSVDPVLEMFWEATVPLHLHSLEPPSARHPPSESRRRGPGNVVVLPVGMHLGVAFLACLPTRWYSQIIYLPSYPDSTCPFASPAPHGESGV